MPTISQTTNPSCASRSPLGLLQRAYPLITKSFHRLISWRSVGKSDGLFINEPEHMQLSIQLSRNILNKQHMLSLI